MPKRKARGQDVMKASKNMSLRAKRSNPLRKIVKNSKMHHHAYTNCHCWLVMTWGTEGKRARCQEGKQKHVIASEAKQSIKENSQKFKNASPRRHELLSSARDDMQTEGKRARCQEGKLVSS